MLKTHQAPVVSSGLMMEAGSVNNCLHPTISHDLTQASETVTQKKEATPAQAQPANVNAIQKFDLRPYQQRAIEEIENAISGGFHSIMIQSPTGSGKGVMLSHIIKLCHQRGYSVLFLVHRQEILYQVSEYMNKYGIAHGIIKAGVKHEDYHHVQLATFQTIFRRIKSPYIKQAEVVIVDEAHHATAKTFLRVIEQFKKKLALGFSATPARKSGLGLGNLFDKIIQVASIQELTDLGYLAPVRVYGPVTPDLQGVKMTAGDYNGKQLENAMLMPGVVGDVVGHYLKFGQNRKAMVFAAGVKHSIALCQQFQAAGITAEHVDGKTAKEVRDNVLARFKVGNIQVIVNCMIFTEGVDVPDIGCVVLARPTKSLVMYMQMVGRGMRAVAGKTDCILLDHAGAVHEHGFPDEITEWELSTSGKIVNKKHEQRKKKESEPISCPLCSLLYTKQMVCPNCGNIPTRDQFGKDIDYIDGALGEVVRKSIRRKVQTKPDRPIGPIEADCYRQLQRYALERNYKPGWVAHTFREIYGVWPDRYKHLPPAPAISADVAKYIKYSHIKHAKFVAKQVT